MDSFDFDGFRQAFVDRDADRWLAYYGPEIEWREYRHQDPPSAPNVMRGLDQVGTFLQGVCAAPISFTLSNEVIGEGRGAFTVTVDLGGGRRIVENVIITHREGKIVEQIDVEAWDH